MIMGPWNLCENRNGHYAMLMYMRFCTFVVESFGERLKMACLLAQTITPHAAKEEWLVVLCAKLAPISRQLVVAVEPTP